MITIKTRQLCRSGITGCKTNSKAQAQMEMLVYSGENMVTLAYRNEDSHWIETEALPVRKLKYFLDWLRKKEWDYRYQFCSGIVFVGIYYDRLGQRIRECQLEKENVALMNPRDLPPGKEEGLVTLAYRIKEKGEKN